jgi:signal transduction histidine kinase
MTPDWFTENRVLVYFVYGLVFFILGIAILLQTRNYSRLHLARSLPWLGWFGILHGLYEWGEIFIPIQVSMMGDHYFSIYDFVQHILLAVSFAALFQFGIELLRPSSRAWRWIRLIPMIVLITWAVGPFILGYIFSPNVQDWHGFANALTRYMLCIPGSILSGIGLIRQAKLQIEPMKVARIGRMLHIAAGALFAYGFFAGLITPEANIFPASILNADWLLRTFHVPPPVFRSLCGLILLIAIVRALEVFNIETYRMIRAMEEAQVIAIERERIARDIHDGALQQVYASGLLAQSLQKRLEGKAIAETSQLVLTINQAIEQLRAFLPQLKPDPKSIDLVGALTPVIEEAKRNVAVKTEWKTRELPALTPDQTSHLTAFVSEALSNVIRHSKSDIVEIRFNCDHHHLIIEIEDQGEGISPQAEPGYGLKNMRDRARLLGGVLSINAPKGKGTLVKLDIPVEDKGEKDSLVDC